MPRGKNKKGEKKHNKKEEAEEKKKTEEEEDDEDDDDDDEDEDEESKERRDKEANEDDEYQQNRGEESKDEYDADELDRNIEKTSFTDTERLHGRDSDILSKRYGPSELLKFVGIDDDTYTACQLAGKYGGAIFRDYRRRYKESADPRSYARDIQPPDRPRKYERLYCGANPILRSGLLQWQCQRTLGGAKEFENPFPFYDRVGRSAECMNQGKRAVAQHGLAAVAPGLASLVGLARGRRRPAKKEEDDDDDNDEKEEEPKKKKSPRRKQSKKGKKISKTTTKTTTGTAKKKKKK